MFGLSPLDRDLGWDEAGETGPHWMPRSSLEVGDFWLLWGKKGGLGSNSIGFDKNSVNEHEVFNI